MSWKPPGRSFLLADPWEIGYAEAMNETAQPHDRFIELLLSDPEKAGTLVRERLSKELSELLSPEPPELVEV
ncbi:MAG: Rpn family recombination-promoting nuclease/putative transposase [Magnetococcales bacterium]|nr:Rpn family recombination-promoting nuclease/putative transposase [Magnetococcales bacterium]MBF0116555.1 Rpn family recombination-promoting nuclease/putative transposase [Magnetococcales bacterium]